MKMKKKYIITIKLTEEGVKQLDELAKERNYSIEGLLQVHMSDFISLYAGKEGEVTTGIVKN